MKRLTFFSRSYINYVDNIFPIIDHLPWGIHLLLLHAEAGGIWVKSIFLLLSLFLKILLLHDGIELHVVEQADLPLGLHNHWSLASLHAKSSMAEPSLRLHIGPDARLRHISKRQLPSLVRGRFCLFGWGSCKLHNLKKTSVVLFFLFFKLQNFLFPVFSYFHLFHIK